MLTTPNIHINYNAETDLLKVSAFFLSFPITNEYTMLMHQTQSDANMLVNQAVLELLEFFKIPHSLDDLKEEENRDTAQILLEHYILVKNDEIESREAQTEPDELVIWLHLTDRCNFRCTYCYLPHAPQQMTMETAKQCIRKALDIANLKDFHHLQIKYSGGEPLLRFPMVLKLHDFAQQLAKEKGIPLSEIVLSNGALLNEDIIQKLTENNIALMVSLDQLKDNPEEQRVTADGHKTSSLVRRNIELALQHSLKPQISITVSKQNIDSLPDLVEWLLAHDLLFSLNFYRGNLYSAKDHNLQFTDEDMIAGLKKTYKRIETNLPDWNLLASLADRANLSIPHSHPCGWRNYLVFCPEGEIAVCHMDMDNSQSTLSDRDPFSIISTNSNGFTNVNIDERPDCRECP